MNKYTIHERAGVYTGWWSTSKEKMIEKCNSITYYAEVCEEYTALSPWTGKLTPHARTVYKNNKT